MTGIKNLKPFQKGQSGNPKGRPKGRPNIKTMMRGYTNMKMQVPWRPKSPDMEFPLGSLLIAVLVRKAVHEKNVRACKILLDRIDDMEDWELNELMRAQQEMQDKRNKNNYGYDMDDDMDSLDDDGLRLGGGLDGDDDEDDDR